MEPTTPAPERRWLGFSKRALIVHGVLAVITVGLWLLVPAAIYTWRRGGSARKVSYGLWGAVGLIGLIIVGAAASGGSDSDKSALPGATTQEAAATSSTREAEQTEPEPATTEAPTPPPTTQVEPPDTGRMSETEYEMFSSQLADVDIEVGEYGEKLGKCGVLLQAAQLAEASDCIGEAYEGVEGDMLGAYSTTDSLQGDVAKGCLKALRLYKERLDIFYGWQTQTKEAGENLQFDEFGTLASLAPTMSERYRQARNWVLRDCEPR